MQVSISMRHLPWRPVVGVNKVHTIVIDQGDFIVAHHPVTQNTQLLGLPACTRRRLLRDLRSGTLGLAYILKNILASILVARERSRIAHFMTYYNGRARLVSHISRVC